MRARRKRGAGRKLAFLLTLTAFTGVISACQVGDTEVVLTSEFSKNEVFRIGDESCTLSEAKVFLANYQNIYGTAYGVDLWAQDFGKNSLEQYVKDLAISQLAQMISMDLLAKEQEISLTEEERAQIEAAAKAYYDSLSEAEISYMDVDEDCIRELYRQYGMANKLYASLTQGISGEVSDDEARVMEAQQIFVTSSESAQAVSAGLENETDFLSLAGTYNEASETEVTFGRGELPAEVEEVAFALQPEEVSGEIVTDEGTYFIKCINNYNQELTDANKQQILEQRRKEAFNDVYDAFVATLSSRFNEELWDSVRVEASEEIQTDSFFEVYEEYCKF